jgi:thiamine pyrophosphate-dependent acetolactate synthase large subunit-like protein
VIAGDVQSSIIDTSALEELNPYFFFQTASLYTARIVNPLQVRAVVETALRTALADRGPTVISLPGDVAVAPVNRHSRSGGSRQRARLAPGRSRFAPARSNDR